MNFAKIAKKGTRGCLEAVRNKDPTSFTYITLITEAFLRCLLPSGKVFIPALNWENFNTKTWEIRKDTIRLTYARTVIVGAFMSGGLEFNTMKKQDILIIGLGGGVLNNYFAQMKNQTLNITVVDIDPVMKTIAKKWFGFEESPLHRIIIDDGVRFIHDAAKKGLSYLGLSTRFDCDFSRGKVRYHYYRCAVIVDIVTQPDAREEAQKMLFCSAKENNSYLDNRDELHNRFVAVDKALGFQLIEKGQYPPD
ncbi:unnamed protein product [Strongylus vulgaris]|uniref:PABS domain-containing protein n=1 Tax=Strongylus vulgaris TaxID=40348 RepID=A0A3P7L994_STRVU|nr:unnamed protein product [Strongylus vulgaris]